MSDVAQWLLPALIAVAAIAGAVATALGHRASTIATGAGMLVLLGAAALVALAANGAVHATLLAASVLACASVGGPVVVLVMALAGLDRATPRAMRASLPAQVWIGIVERLAFTAALLLVLPEVAAVVIAVKALGTYTAPAPATPPAERAGDRRSLATRNDVAAARVLGTLVSVAWATASFAVWRFATR